MAHVACIPYYFRGNWDRAAAGDVCGGGVFLFTGRRDYLRLARKWAKGTGLLFAIGAVSGTALSFELGLLWPRYVAMMGAAVGHAFAPEGFAFFIEAIFIGLYLYGWGRMRPVTHWLCAGVVAASGFASGVLVLAVNTWMQLPVGFTLDATGRVIATDPLAIFKTYAWVTMSVHSSLACYESVGLAMGAVYALAWLRGRRDAYCKSAILISLAIGGSAAILQPISGDAIAKFVYRTQPAKFAAMEAQFKTMSHAPLHLGGIPDMAHEQMRDAIEIPDGLSFLAAHKASAVVQGLDDIPRNRWPNVTVTHLAFDVMAGCGTLVAVVMGIFWAVYLVERGKVLDHRALFARSSCAGRWGLWPWRRGGSSRKSADSPG